MRGCGVVCGCDADCCWAGGGDGFHCDASGGGALGIRVPEAVDGVCVGCVGGIPGGRLGLDGCPRRMNCSTCPA